MEMLLVAGDEAGAWNLVEEALASGATPDAVLLDIICPSMHSIGERWSTNELSIGAEHVAAAVALRLISRIGARFTPRGRKRGAVLLASPSGDRHNLPVAIVANLLRWRGYTVIEVGADVPPEELAEVARHATGLVAIGISCTFPEAVSAARHAITAIRDHLGAVTIFIGGMGVQSADEARDAGADYFTGTNGRDVLRVLDELTTLSKSAA
jgi:methanogenic corrinoid protein MtbC1